MSATINKPVFKPEISFEIDLREQLERATVLHCLLTHATSMRIWPNTVLVQNCGARKNLIQAYNIPEYPTWKYVRAGHIFTLVFEGLDKGCKSFDLIEEIPEPGDS
jgi:hypothetical protein